MRAPALAPCRFLPLVLCVLAAGCSRGVDRIAAPAQSASPARPDLVAGDLFIRHATPAVAAHGRPLGVAWQPAEMLVGVPETFAVRVHAIGHVPRFLAAFRTNATDIADAEETLGDDTWNELGGWRWTAPDTGTFMLHVTLDPYDGVPERDETNNDATLTLHAGVGGFEAQAIEFVDESGGHAVHTDTAPAGASVATVVTVAGRGAYANVREVVTANGVVVLDQRVDLSGGVLDAKVRRDTLRFTAAGGDVTYRVQLDPEREFPREAPADDAREAVLHVVTAPAP